MKNRKKLIIKICLTILFFVVMVILYLGARKIETSLFSGELAEVSKKYNDMKENQINYQGVWYEKKKNTDVLLVMGIDHFEGEENNESQQADFLVLLVIDHDEKKITCITINRDTMTDIQTFGALDDYLGTQQTQIAVSHAYGSDERERCKNTRWAVENLFYGIDIDNYISFTMEAVPVLNDLVGGVPVEIKDDFTNIDESLVLGTTVRLSREQALTYIRAREGMDEATNINRMARQKEYMQAFLQCTKACAEKDSCFYLEMLNSIEDYMVMDCSSSEIIELDRVLREYSYENIIDLAGESRKGTDYMEYYIDENALEKLIIEMFYIES